MKALSLDSDQRDKSPRCPPAMMPAAAGTAAARMRAGPDEFVMDDDKRFETGAPYAPLYQGGLDISPKEGVIFNYPGPVRACQVGWVSPDEVLGTGKTAVSRVFSHKLDGGLSFVLVSGCG